MKVSPFDKRVLNKFYAFLSAISVITSIVFLFVGECKIVCVNRYCMNLLYAPYWGKQR